jgi:hypothetical protein
MARFLYIVARDQAELYQEMYEHLRRDLETVTVELTFDRRRAERRQQADKGGVERRVRDRREHELGGELARHGWARVEIE